MGSATTRACLEPPSQGRYLTSIALPAAGGQIAGSIPVARGRDMLGLGVISGALTLVTNAVIVWNAARLQKAVDAEVVRGTVREVSVNAPGHIGPVAYAHINFRGRTASR
jgi:hypothetical protein